MPHALGSAKPENLLLRRMKDDMDANCGTILDGEETVQQCGARIFGPNSICQP
jgi:altronate dehydratase